MVHDLAAIHLSRLASNHFITFPITAELHWQNSVL